jgi:sugar phosphate isomerase/epimerase
MERTAPLSPFAYVVHFHGDQRGPCPSLDLARWHEEHRRSVERLLEAAAPQDLCVEHLDYPFSMIKDIVCDYGLSVCLDVGHLLLYGHDPKAFLDRYLPQTRIVHLHGVVEGVDHCSLSFLPEGLLAAVVERLGNGAQKPRVVTMEIFDEGALNQSLDFMSQFVE